MTQPWVRAWRCHLAVAVIAFFWGASSSLAQSPYPPSVEPGINEAPVEPAKADESAAPAPVASPAPPEENAAPVVDPVAPAPALAAPAPKVRIYDSSATVPATPTPPKASKTTSSKPAGKPASKPAVKPAAKPPASKKATTKKPTGGKTQKTATSSRTAPVKTPAKPPARVTSPSKAAKAASTPKKPVVASKPRPSSVSLERRRVLGKNVVVVRVNMNDQNVHITPVLPTRGLGKGASFDSLVRGSSAVAIINGGYFHPRTFSLAGDLVVDGRHVSKGRVRTTLGITKDNKVVVRKTTTITRKGWKEFETAIGNGPFILHNGKVTVYPKAEGYRDAAVWSSAARSAIGITKDGKLFFLSTKDKLNLYQLAKVMRALGARDAITLDGGSSVGIAYKGKVMLRPARSIAYGIGVYVTTPKVVARSRS